MGERTSYAPGTFSWSELVTSDADGAKSFYSGALRLELRGPPDPGRRRVHDGSSRRQAGRGAVRRDQPPHWNCYVTVASVDETTGARRRARRQRHRRAVRRDGVRADVGDRRPDRRRPVPVGAAPAHRRRARQRAGRADVERPRHARPGGRLALLRRAVRLDDRGDPRRRRLPRDPQRRADERRHAAVRSRARATRRRAGCRTSGTRTSSASSARSTASAGSSTTARSRCRRARSRSSATRRARCSRSGPAATQD